MRSTLIHPSGKLMVALGVNYHKLYELGDLIVELKWVNEEPVMLLYKHCLGANSPAYMIEHKDAHKFAQSNGNATKALVIELAADAAKAIGAENDKATAFRIIDAIMNYITDLLMMPPAPKEIVLADQPGSGNDELKVICNGKVIAEALV